MDTVARRDPASVRVVCLGLSRTGTSSLSQALVMLGFGPCYHMFSILQQGGNDLPQWFKISDGLGTPQDFDALFRGYCSVLDQPPALFPAEIYTAYPDAKFILTTRDPITWEKSIKSTLLRSIRTLRDRENRSPIQESLAIWNECHLTRYHGGRLFSHAQQELVDHEERVKQIIPPEKLLVYQVGEGWDKLAKFLDVPAPEIPFPHLNDTAHFQAVMKALGIDISDSSRYAQS